MSLPVSMPEKGLEFRVAQGAGLRDVARGLNQAGVLVHPGLFVLLARLESKAGALKAGVYGLTPGLSPQELLDLLVSGKTLYVDVQLLEGQTFRQWKGQLSSHPGLEHVLNTLSDKEVMRLAGWEGDVPEGLFFPDTYRVDKYATDLEVLLTAAKTMRRRLDQEWEGREAGLPYKNAYEALIMASIVEKETGIEADRPLVAGVFVNRLRVGMLLQTDPTVIYGLGEEFGGNLRKIDLKTDTPYNTYTRHGLPPTPIAMPGLNSLRAALHPAKTSAFYFVARGDGSSQFSISLSEHNQAVDFYQRRPRRPRR